jgi:hypothetical protein
MDLDGPVRVVRWRGAGTVDAAGLVRSEALEVLGELPYGDGDDHAEGIAVPGRRAPSADEGTRLLVVYDSPAAGRRTPDGGVLADLVALPGRVERARPGAFTL